MPVRGSARFPVVAGKMSSGLPRSRTHPSIPLHRDPRARAIFYQAVIAAIVVWLVYSILSNTIANLEARGIKTGISFFDTVAPFALPLEFSPFIGYELGVTKYWDIFLIGIQNTILIGVLGVISATILGFFVGIVRLSPNWLVSKLAGVYIEVFRNTPLLLQLFFWNFIVFLDALPSVRESWVLGDDFIVVNKVGVVMARPDAVHGWLLLLAFLVFCATVAAHVCLRRKALREFEETGKFRSLAFPLLGIWAVGLAVVSISLEFGAVLDYPQRGRFVYSGGMTFPLAAFVLWFSLTVYTAAFIAENVRGGVLAVPKGQTEAARSLGFHWLKTLQLVVIPQAMRVIIPPTISQYLNLTKNSSLAVAVAYPDIVNIWAGIALNQTGQALIVIAMTILVYEMLSLFTSGFLNYYNSRVQLSER